MTPILDNLCDSLGYLGKYDKPYRIGAKLTKSSPDMLFSVLLPGLYKILSYGYITNFTEIDRTLEDNVREYSKPTKQP